MSWPFIAASTAVAINLVGYVFYGRDILCGTTKPHLFSWFVWGLTLGIATAGAVSGGAFASALVLFAHAAIVLFIGVATFYCGEHEITRSDWVAFLSALVAIPLWLVTKEALWAIGLVTLIDLLGYYPTLRKTWSKPLEENKNAFIIWSIASVFSVLSIRPMTLMTGLYPITTLLLNVTVLVEIFVRRRALPRRSGA